MALKRGLIGLDTHMPAPCRGGMRLGNRVFRCWKKEGHGSLDLVGAVAASCDVYFYQLGLRLGLDAIIQDGVLMGFRDKSGIDLENEVDPIYPATTAYFDRLYGPRHWSPPATTLNFSIGQGENTQTLINMMRFYEGLVGRRERRRAVSRAARAGAKPRSLGLTPEQLDGLRRALIAVVEHGTASASRHADLAVAGKTGHRAEPARQGPRLVHRLRAGRQARAGRRRHHGVRGARHDRGARTSSARSAATSSARTPPARQGQGPAGRGGGPQDTAPRPVELDPDSAAAQAAGGQRPAARGQP